VSEETQCSACEETQCSAWQLADKRTV